MAQETLDHTLNSDLGREMAKLNAMLTELYNNGGGGGALTGTSVAVTGAATSATMTATGLGTVGSLTVDTGTKTATATAGAATLAKNSGVITTEALTTAAAAAYTLTLTNSTIAATDIVLASVQNGTNTQGIPVISRVTPGSSSVVILVHNLHASEALNGTLKISFVVFQA